MELRRNVVHAQAVLFQDRTRFGAVGSRAGAHVVVGLEYGHDLAARLRRAAQRVFAARFQAVYEVLGQKLDLCTNNSDENMKWIEREKYRLHI